MNYRRALEAVATYRPFAKVDARTLSKELMDVASQPQNFAQYATLAREYSTKRISGDLDRLYRMGLLKRKRIPRIVYPKDSPPSRKGFMYGYEITRQGWQYLEYLQKPKSTDPATYVEQQVQKMMSDHIHFVFPGTLADIAEEDLLESKHEDRGRYNRFPSKRYRDLAAALMKCQDRLRRTEQENKMLRNMLPSHN